jgi:hypothetical protein
MMMRKNRLWLLVIGLIVVIEGFWTVDPRESSAIPAWTRKYGADCSMCHYPAVPRLNATGQRFRWAGYRIPDEFGKEPDTTNVGNYLAVRGRGRYVYANPEGRNRQSEFQWNDATLFYAGAITENISAFNEIEREAEDEIGLVAQVQGIWGSPTHFSTVRFGQFHPLYRVGIGGFDRPTGISAPSLFSDRLTRSEVPFRVASDQRGVEAAHVIRNSRLLVQVLNGIDETGSGTDVETDTDKDLVIAYERILDDLASGLTLYGYRGVWHDGVLPDDFRFYRYGAAANKIFSAGFEIMGGYIRSNDDRPSGVGQTIQGDSFFVDLEHYFRTPDLTVLARYDWIDPDRDAGGDNRNKQTVGVVQTLQRYLRIAFEGSRSTDDLTDLTDYQATAEAMINF